MSFYLIGAYGIAIELDKVIISLFHLLDLVGQLSLAPLVNVGDRAAKSLDQSLSFVNNRSSLIVFDLRLHNKR